MIFPATGRTLEPPCSIPVAGQQLEYAFDNIGNRKMVAGAEIMNIIRIPGLVPSRWP